MRRPGDDNYGRSSSGLASGRAAVLLAVAVVLGIVLLNAADDSPSTAVSTGTDDTVPEEDATTSTLATTTIVTLPPRAPADVKVIAANGTDVKGVAKRATDQLKAAGYNVLSPTDASAKAQASAVFYAGDFMREAAAIGTGLGLPPAAVQALPTPPPVADARGANIVVVVGPELAAQLAATAPTSSTTAAGAGGGTATSTTRP